MKQEWMIQRWTTEQKDGQRRWDLAYQCLLSWGRERTELAQNNQEVQNESGHLCTGFDPKTNGKSDN